MNLATYNITSDKIKLFLDERLSASDYEAAKHYKYVWYPGQKCFCAKWNPSAENFALRFVEEISEDDEPDNVEARVSRFAKYANEAETSAESSQKYLTESANTERRKRNALNSIDKNLDAAAHWNRRIENAIGHAQYKDLPEVISRRIKGLRADLAKFTREVKQAETNIALWTKVNSRESAMHVANHGFQAHSYKFTKDKFPNSTYEGSQNVWSALDKDTCTFEQAKEMELRANQGDIAHATRWINHINDRITYETAYYESVGGTDEMLNPKRKKAIVHKETIKSRAGQTPEKFGAWGYNNSFGNKPEDTKWSFIIKVNKTTIETIRKITEVVNGTPRNGFYTSKQHICVIQHLKTAAEVATEMPNLLADYTEYKVMLERIEARKAAHVS